MSESHQRSCQTKYESVRATGTPAEGAVSTEALFAALHCTDGTAAAPFPIAQQLLCRSTAALGCSAPQ